MGAKRYPTLHNLSKQNQRKMKATNVKVTCTDSDIKLNVLYSCPIDSLTINLGGHEVNVTDTLKSGRTNYELFQYIICWFFSLKGGVGVDLVDPSGNKYEIKSFLDHDVHPRNGKKEDLVHTAASKAFGPNNSGPIIKEMVRNNEYEKALSLCRELSYDKVDYFIYTNTRQFNPSQPFKFMAIDKDDVMNMLDPKDPRCISRRSLLASCTETVPLSPS